MTFREEMAQIAAQITLEIDEELGATITSYTFASTGTTIQNVPCNPTGRNTQSRVGMASLEDWIQTISIPVSDVWPLTNKPKNYDTIVYAGTAYQINGISWDNLNAVMTAKLVRREPT